MGSQRVRHDWATFTSLRFSALNWHLFYWMGSLGGASGKECAYPCRRLKRRGFDPWVRKIPWGRKWHPTSEFLPGKFDRQRSMGATVHEATRSWTLLSDWSNTHTHTHTHTTEMKEMVLELNNVFELGKEGRGWGRLGGEGGLENNESLNNFLRAPG